MVSLHPSKAVKKLTDIFRAAAYGVFWQKLEAKETPGSDEV
jgi:hypothetical protein